jgi:hypothetical protein
MPAMIRWANAEQQALPGSGCDSEGAQKAVMEFHRLGIKFFAADPASIRLEKFIPIFHGWIQKQSVTGHLLIDIHDYSHMHQGPGILLVAHEGNFSIDMSDGRPGLLYYRKKPTALSPVEHLTTIIRSALQACRLLEEDASIRFSTDELLIIANDRLSAPNNEETFAELQPVLAAALEQVLDKSDLGLTRANTDPKERFAVRVDMRSGADRRRGAP